jgi:hypothetical protein
MFKIKEKRERKKERQRGEEAKNSLSRAKNSFLKEGS